MRKIVYPIQIQCLDGIFRNVKVSISFKESRLSIVGTSPIMRGQIKEYLENLDPKDYRLCSGWTEEMYRRLLDIWERWHLNDMRECCFHQRRMGWNRDEHLDKPCPICGHKYGRGFIFEPVPDKVIEWLFNLPEWSV